MQKKSGFTLVEMVITTLIIGILASIGSLQYFKAVERGRAAEAYATLAHIADAQNTRRAQAGAYTTLWGDLDTFAGAPRSLNFNYTLAGPLNAVARRNRAKNSYFMCYNTGRRGACIDADDCPVQTAVNCGSVAVIPLY